VHPERFARIAPEFGADGRTPCGTFTRNFSLDIDPNRRDECHRKNTEDFDHLDESIAHAISSAFPQPLFSRWVRRKAGYSEYNFNL
jgi:hypothetical protein